MTTDRDYLQSALNLARRESHDPNTQTGAILLVGGSRYEAANRIPDSLLREEFDSSLVQPPRKCAYIEHAERAVIYEAAKGVHGEEDFRDGVLYAPWFACPDCARAIVSVGIREVVGLASLQALTPRRWIDAVETGQRILSRGGVSQRWICGEVGAKIRFDGREVLL